MQKLGKILQIFLQPSFFFYSSSFFGFIGEVFVSSVYVVPYMYVRMFIIRDGMLSWLVCMYIRCYIENPAD